MCGRYCRTTQEEELARRYDIPIPTPTDLPISWNIAPRQNVLFVRYNSQTGQRSLEANELLAQIHNRMPVILPEELHAAWLGETAMGDLKTLLQPFPASEMKMLEISPRVNSPKNTDPDIIRPLDLSAGLPESEELFSS